MASATLSAVDESWRSIFWGIGCPRGALNPAIDPPASGQRVPAKRAFATIWARGPAGSPATVPDTFFASGEPDFVLISIVVSNGMGRLNAPIADAASPARACPKPPPSRDPA